MDKLKKQIETRIYWIRVDKKKMVILIKGNSKTDTRKKLQKMAKKGDINNAIIYRVVIKFHSGKIYNDGILSFALENYKIIKNKLKKYYIDGKGGYIWFSKEWLLENGWNKKYISHAVNLLRTNKADIIIPGITFYHLLGKN